MKYFFSRNLYYSMFALSFCLLYVIGPALSSYLNNQGYYKPFDNAILYQAALFFSLFSLSYFFFKNITKNKKQIRYRPVRKHIYTIPLALTGLALMLYFVKNGFVISKLDGYETRYTANVGAGIYTQFMQLFYFFIAGLIYKKGVDSPKKLILISLAFFVITFALLGGHRQLGLGVIIGIFFYLMLEKKISPHSFLIIFIPFLIFSLAIAVLRYENDSLDIEQIIKFVIIFFYDGLTPTEAHTNILQYVHSNGYPGLSIITNQFGAYIPRDIWTDKPLLMLNGGNYYTSIVLGRTSVVTYSPTLLGELILAHGPYFYFAAIPTGVLFCAIDRSVNARTYFGITMILFSFTIIFNFYREGLYVFLTKIIFIFIFSRILYAISRTRPKRSPPVNSHTQPPTSAYMNKKHA